MDNRNLDGILWHKTAEGYWINKSCGLQHVYVWQQAHQATIDKGDVVHHINRDRSDNRIENLQLLTNEDHARLHGELRGRKSKSGYKGVYWHSATKKWTSQITFHSRLITIGYYVVAEEAALAYDAKARELWGDDAFQNFPQR